MLSADDESLSLLDLPDALLQRVLGHLLHPHDQYLQSVCLAACACTSLQRAVHSCFAVCTHLEAPAKASPGVLRAVCPRAHSLSTLNLGDSFRWVDDEALDMVSQLESLTSLSLQHCRAITAAGVAALCSGRLCNLRVLSLRSAGSSMCGIGDGAVLAALPALQVLDVAWCRTVKGQAMAAYAPRLLTLSVHGCEMVDDTLCAALHQVEDLDLAFTGVGDGGLLALAAGSPKLRRLVLAAVGSFNLWTTGMWTEPGMREFQRLRPEVQLLYASC